MYCSKCGKWHDFGECELSVINFDPFKLDTDSYEPPSLFESYKPEPLNLFDPFKLDTDSYEPPSLFESYKPEPLNLFDPFKLDTDSYEPPSLFESYKPEPLNVIDRFTLDTDNYERPSLYESYKSELPKFDSPTFDYELHEPKPLYTPPPVRDTFGELIGNRIGSTIYPASNMINGGMPMHIEGTFVRDNLK